MNDEVGRDVVGRDMAVSPEIAGRQAPDHDPADRDLQDQNSPDQGLPDQGPPDIELSDHDGSDETSSELPSPDTPPVDDRPPAVLRLERAQRLKREGEIARAEHDAAVVATDQKTARLKALRLEREAADRIVAAKEAAAKAELKPAAKRKRVVKAPA